MILLIVALPLALSLIVLLLRDLRSIATLLTLATLLVMTVLLLGREYLQPLVVWGRTVSLSALEAEALAFCTLLLAIMILYAWRMPQCALACPLTLVAIGLFAGATMIENRAIAGLVLELGAIAAIMLIPSRENGAAMTGMRTLVLLALAGPLILLAAWAIETRALNPENLLLPHLGSLTLVIGFGIGLSAIPFHIWLPPVFRYGNSLSAVMLSVVFNLVVLLQLNSTLQISMWPGGREFFASLLLGAGILTSVGGSLMALPQRALHRALAYTALADLGIILIGLGLDTKIGAAVATLHIIYRGLGIVLASMALGVLRQWLGADDAEHLGGAFRRAPLAVAGVTIGGLSLAGFPLSAGFSTRLALYRALAAAHPGWAIVLIACSLGPLWAFVRCLIAAISPAPTPGGQQEPRLPGSLILLLSLILVAIGLLPSLISLLPAPWLEPILAGTL